MKASLVHRTSFRTVGATQRNPVSKKKKNKKKGRKNKQKAKPSNFSHISYAVSGSTLGWAGARDLRL